MPRSSLRDGHQAQSTSSGWSHSPLLPGDPSILEVDVVTVELSGHVVRLAVRPSVDDLPGPADDALHLAELRLVLDLLVLVKGHGA